MIEHPPRRGKASINSRFNSPEDYQTSTFISSTLGNLQQLAFIDAKARHVNMDTSSDTSHRSTVVPRQMAFRGLLQKAADGMTTEIAQEDASSPDCYLSDQAERTKINEGPPYMNYFEQDLTKCPHEHVFKVITGLLNDLTETEPTQRGIITSILGLLWSSVQRTMAALDVTHAERVLTLQAQLEAILGHCSNNDYAVKSAKDFLEKRKRSQPSSANNQSSYVGSKQDMIRRANNEWVMLYKEKMCDHSLYPHEDSNRKCFSVPLSVDFLPIMDATETPRKYLSPTDELVNKLSLISSAPNADPSKEEMIEKLEQVYNNIILGATRLPGRLFDVQSPDKVLKKIPDSFFISEGEDLRLHSLINHAWTDVPPRILRWKGEEVASPREWMRQLRGIYGTQYTDKDQILVKRARHHHTPMQLSSENVEGFPGRVLPGFVLRKVLGRLNYTSWTLTSPKFAGMDKITFEPKVDSDELSRHLTLKIGRPELLLSDSDDGLPNSLLSSHVEDKLKAIQFCSANHELMPDCRFVSWMEGAFEPRISNSKTFFFNFTSNRHFHNSGFCNASLKDRKHILQIPFFNPENESEIGAMFRAVPLDIEKSHTGDPEDDDSPLTPGFPRDLEGSKTEIYYRLRNLGESLPTWFIRPAECKNSGLIVQTREELQRLAVMFAEGAGKEKLSDALL
jgi:hypothetical protein